MRQLLAVASLVTLAALATTSQAQTSTDTAAPSAAAAKPDVAASGTSTQAAAAPATAPKIVCHRETPTGSTIAHSVCEREDTVHDHQMATDLAAAAQRNRPIVTHAGG